MINNEYDSSFRSVKFLYKRVTDILENQFQLDNFFCPDLGEVSFEDLNVERTVNILMFGSFVRSFFELGHWPFKSIRIWVLSHSVKGFLINEFGLDDKSISVIPRNLILDGIDSPDIDWKENLELIYAGRLNEAKNIECLIHTVHSLQMKYDLNVKLTLLGDFDPQEKVYVEYKKRAQFKVEVISLIESLSWKQAPRILPFIEQDEWTKKEYVNPVFISLSTNIFEDYGVSVQQALNEGWPVIVSGWGGHLDITQDHYQVPYSLITAFDESAYRGEQIASYLLEAKKIRHIIDREFYLADTVEMIEINKMKHRAVKRYGAAAFSIMRSEWNELFFSKEGIQFIERYRKSFTQKEALCHDVLIVSDYYNNKDLFPDVLAFLDGAIQKSIEEKKGLLIFSYIELCSKEVWEKIMKSQRVYLGIRDVKNKLNTSYNKLCELFEEKDIVVLDVGK
ncbi:glycosyltransferase [Bacteriovorax sp. DB6_IX]|uniref:glycosyltransferase n=1 Tax=Bacteriovorax sp. DB6_IX TaxID=1353530 RepID=UPI000389ECA5|nr:glycosyltransferase [Bacteriovorax sp. DB6_IX]EQC50899.1 glycosyltransferase, group 1 family protein [Bacteriovorax sp. DB6_IX]